MHCSLNPCGRITNILAVPTIFADGTPMAKALETIKDIYNLGTVSVYNKGIGMDALAIELFTYSRL